MFERLRNLFQPEPKPVKQRPIQIVRPHPLQASYDTLAKTPENYRHWQWIDYRAADSSLNPEVRIAIRAQARYELQENNCYGHGLANTLVTDTIGTGPRLQVIDFTLEENQRIEQAFHNWMNAVGLTEKLATLRMAKLIDGEAVARFITNIQLEDPVSLDLQLIEADQLRSPNFEHILSENYVDGVRLDRFGNPVAYDILRHHPGANYYTTADTFAYDTYSASQIIHVFRPNRPGQHRGVSEFAPALPLFAFLRRFTLATVAAAETAASVSQVITTDAPIPEELEDEYAASTFEKYMEAIPVDRNSATVLPNQWRLDQLQPEHPTTTYPMFKRELVAEIGRVVGIPANIALADSGESNYSSARFDHLGYERTIKKEQNYFNRMVLDRIFSQWLIEAALTGVLRAGIRNKVLRYADEYGSRGLANSIGHAWHWDGLRDADQQNAAQAERLKMQNGTTHRARAYAEQGLDVEVEDAKAAESLGMSKAQYREWVAASIFTNGNIIGKEPANDPSGKNESQSTTESPEAKPAEQQPAQ